MLIVVLKMTGCVVKEYEMQLVHVGLEESVQTNEGHEMHMVHV